MHDTLTNGSVQFSIFHLQQIAIQNQSSINIST